jgi:phenylpropionate dioxygenase-like ring-hydroxylating dioxygenase large terminal subunit
MPFPDVTRHFHPVLAASGLRDKPVRVEVAGKAFALFRDRSGRAGALLDRCPHRFSPLSKGRVRPDGRLACPYHGWNFDVDGHGCSPSQPSLKLCDVESFQVLERHGWLWLAAKDTSLDQFPELAGDEWDFAGAFSTPFAAPLHVAFDNFSEDEHTPWVHHFLGWHEENAGKIDFSAKNYDDRTEVSYAAPQRGSPWLPFLLVRRGDRFHNEWISRFSPVHTIYSIHWSDPRTGARRPVESRIAIFFVPETEKTTRLTTFVFSRLTVPWLRPLQPVIRRVGVRVAKNEVEDDARFIPTVAETPFDLKGMRLGLYDKPIIRNHKLLESIYYGQPPSVEKKPVRLALA